MKKLLLTYLFLISISFCTNAQIYGNEWIDFSLEYYKIETAQDGIYALDDSYFSNSGIDLSSVDPRNLHLYHRGEEVAVLIEGENDGTFDIGDRLLFFGKRNDGVLDSSLYLEGLQPHQYYNLMVDTTAYFLTWNNQPGKRISKSNMGMSGNTEISYGIEKLKIYSDRYLFGKEHLSFIFLSEFDAGEGWFSNVITKGKTLTYSFADINHVQGDSVELEVMLVGANNKVHKCQLQIGSSIVDIDAFSSYSTHTQLIKIASSEITANTLDITLNVLGTLDADAVSIAYYKLNYQSTDQVDFSNPYYFLTSGTGLVDAKLRGVNAGYLFDYTNENTLVAIELTPSVSDLDYTYESNKKMLFVTESELLIPGLAKKTLFEDDLSLGADFLLVTHTDFMSDCQDYKTYRESIEGGGMKVLIADVNRLYNQYNYGERSPVAIRNLVKYMYKLGNAEYLFLVGTGRVVSYQNGSKPYNRHLEFFNSFYDAHNFVPTIGNPGSDVLYSTGLLDNKFKPALATGRLSIWEGSQMKIYLDKVKEHESQTDVAYRKRGLHLSGGETEIEKTSFLNYLKGYETSFNAPNMGGEIISYTKKTSEKVEFFNVSKEINEGVSVVNSFSHSSSQVTEIDIGEVSNEVNGYENKGKYPLIIVNGCHAGDAYNLKNDADNWLFSTADKGAICWFAHSSYGYSNFLDKYTSLLYENLYNNDALWTSSIGKIQQATIVDFMNSPNYSNNSVALSHYSQFQIQGDPFVSIFPFKNADFAVTTSYLSAYDNNPISAASDSIMLNVIVGNKSRAISDSIELCMTRTYEGGFFEYESVKIKSPYNQDTVVLILPNLQSAVGLNQFEITINCLFDVAEVDSSNNTFSFSYFFTENIALPLMPFEFSILKDTVVSFVAQSANRNIENPITYFFEIDTSFSFDTPLFTKNVDAYNYPKLENFELPIKLDSTVYYWRVGLEFEGDTVWSISSFTYIKNKEGFSQTNFNQFYKWDSSNVSRDLSQQEWFYDFVLTEVTAQSGGVDLVSYWKSSWISANGQSVVLQGNRGGCVGDGVFLLTFDKVTGLPYNINGVNQGSCGNRPRTAESFGKLYQLGNQNALQQYIDNTQEGDYILIVSVGNAYFDTWSIGLKNAVEGIGAQLLDDLVNGEPYILLGKKGSAQLNIEERGTSATDIINVIYDLSGQFDVAQIVSPTIGPALSWDTFYRTIDSTESDSYTFDIVGVDLSGVESLLFSNVGEEVDSLDVSSIDASVYPYLKLKTEISDTLHLTPPQLKKWGVTYEPATEGLILYNLIEPRFKDVSGYTEGDIDTLEMWFKNITSVSYNDSIDVVSTIYNLELGLSDFDTITVWGPDAFDSILVKIPVQGDLGLNTLSVYVNFEGVIEHTYSNNFFDWQFVVNPDFSQFILDVTFDGVHIKNADVVAKFPLIEINAFNDYAKYTLGDTSGVKIYLKDLSCVSCDYEAIYFSSPEVSWSQNNSVSGVSVQYLPTHLNNGLYELKLVNSVDATKYHTIQFSVKGSFSISTIELYPNPSSGDVYLAFDLTGESLPDVFSLKLYSNNGELVGELTKADLEFLHVGHNVLKLSTRRLHSGLFIYVFEIQGKGETVIQKGKFVKI